MISFVNLKQGLGGTFKASLMGSGKVLTLKYQTTIASFPFPVLTFQNWLEEIQGRHHSGRAGSGLEAV